MTKNEVSPLSGSLKKRLWYSVVTLILMIALVASPLSILANDTKDGCESSFTVLYDQIFYETEPNNTRSQANLVDGSYFGKPLYYVRGTISNASSDVDYYRFDTSIDGQFAITAYWTGALSDQGLAADLSTQFLDSRGNLLGNLILDPRDPNRRGAFTATMQKGTYYFRIASESTASKFNGATYELYIRFAPSCHLYDPSRPYGPREGYVNTTYSFAGHDDHCKCGAPVQTRFDWGNGTYSSWSSNLTRTKSWADPGMYYVRIQQRCPIHTFIVTEWSDVLDTNITAPIFQLTLESATPALGSVSGGTSQVVGTSVSATASPQAGYRFYRWEEAGETVSRSNPYTFNLMANRTLTGFFRSAIDTQRLSGVSRYQTAVAISQDGWAKGADTVVLARGDDYADALAGVPLAYALNAPILLTNSQYLSASTRTEIQRLGAENAVILGGTGAIRAAVVEELETMSLTVDRIRGDNRYHTAALIAHALRAQDRDFDNAVLAVGTNFPDALAAASYAAMTGQPILLTTRDALPSSTAAAMDALGIQTCIIVGGTGVISSGVEALLDESYTTTRIAGSNRYATSIALAEHFLGSADEYCLATGWDFPDAITGAVLAAKRGTGILLVLGSASAPPAIIQDFLVDEQVEFVTLFGGAAVLSSGMENWF